MDKPEEYSRNISNLIANLKRLYNKYSKYIKWNTQSESILDLGVGDGRAAKEVLLPILPENVNEYIGADISQTMLGFAKETVLHEKFETFQLDAITKSLPDKLLNRFDHIFSNNLIHHVQDTRQLFENVWKMLKPGGQLFFIGYDKLFMNEAYQKLDEGKWNKYKNWKSISPFNNCNNPVEEYTYVIEKLGFTDCHMFVEPYTSRYSEAAFQELFEAVNTRLKYVDEEDKEEYLKDYIEELKQSSPVKKIENGRSTSYDIFTNTIIGIISKPQ